MSIKSSKEIDNLEWNVQHEILLLYAMMGHKPVGVNRYFMMTCIHDKFSKYLNKEISSDIIWKHLDTMYDMAALHESEIIPFPNDEVEFELPEEYDALAVERLGFSLPHSEKQLDIKNSSLKSGKKSGSSKVKQTSSSASSSKGIDSHPNKPSLGSMPVSAKTNKVIPVSKSETSNDASESGSTKVKSESSNVNKGTKNKRSTIPNSDTKSKQDVNLSPQMKVNSTSESQVKKVAKPENPASSKKGSKELTKSDSVESVKKSKDVNASPKKAKSSVNSENSGSRRNSKAEIPVTKKKSETESSAENSSESKTTKTDNRKTELELEQNSTGKASRAPVKAGQVDNPKKRKRMKTEELTTPKKNSPAPKRRR